MQNFSQRKWEIIQRSLNQGERADLSKVLFGPLQRYHIGLLVFIVLSILTVSIWWATYSDKTHIFQRSGNLVIVVAVIFSWFRYARSDFYDKVFKLNHSVFVKVEDEINPHFAPIEHVEIASLRVDRHIAPVKRMVDRQMLRFEIAALVLGTLISGYGDLALNMAMSQISN